METAITLVSPPELTLAEDEKGQFSALVRIKLEETKTLTLVSTDEQFEAAGEQLKAIALLREQIKGTLKPFLEFWHQGHKAHTGLLATLDGPLETRERSMKQGWPGTRRRKRRPVAGRRSGCDEKPRSCAGGWKRKIASGGKARRQPRGGRSKKKPRRRPQPARPQGIIKPLN